MTIKEALEASVHIQLTNKLLEKAIVDAELNGALTYSKLDEQSVDLSAIGLLMTVKSMKTVSEGSYSVTIDKDAVNERLLYLATKYNLTDLIAQLAPEEVVPVPTVKNATNFW